MQLFFFFPLIEVIVFCILIFDYMLEGFLMDQFVTFFYMHGKCEAEFLFWVESRESFKPSAVLLPPFF